MARAPRRLGRKQAALATAALLALAFGCQVIVGSDVPSYRCGSADPSACPSGFVCDVARGECVLPEAPDAPIDDEDAGTTIDASPDEGASPLVLGSACRIDGDCASKLCGTNAMLTPSITAPTGPFCTKTCCTSADCDLGFVCFGPGTGGNYCIPGTKLGRTTTGTKAPGAICGTSAECRSGFCESGRCVDTCCSDQNCAAGSSCRVMSIDAGVVHDGWACAATPGGARDAGVACIDQPECKSNACVPSGGGVCRTPCCGRSSCGAANAVGAGNRCVYGPSANDVYKLCFGGTGTKAVGQACQFDNECLTGYCDAELKQCRDTCCVDDDCPSGQACRPSAVQTPFLRCVPR